MSTPLVDCEDCGAAAGAECDESCPSRAAAEADQIALDLDNPPGRCQPGHGICICGEDSP